MLVCSFSQGKGTLQGATLICGPDLPCGAESKEGLAGWLWFPSSRQLPEVPFCCFSGSWGGAFAEEAPASAGSVQAVLRLISTGEVPESMGHGHGE